MKRAIVGLVLLAGCASITDVTPSSAVPFAPPPIYRVYWAELEACSGLAGNFDNIQWFAVPRITMPNGSGEAAGLWFQDGNRIYIEQAYVDNWLIIKHEEMHALLGHPGHPPEYFSGVCGQLLVNG
jgi:hypothetical protein